MSAMLSSMYVTTEAKKTRRSVDSQRPSCYGSKVWHHPLTLSNFANTHCYLLSQCAAMYNTAYQLYNQT